MIFFIKCQKFAFVVKLKKIWIIFIFKKKVDTILIVKVVVQFQEKKSILIQDQLQIISFVIIVIQQKILTSFILIKIEIIIGQPVKNAKKSMQKIVEKE